MATAQDVLSVAESQIGYSRWDDPEKGTKYGRWYANLVGDSYYAENDVPYCAMFDSWCFAQAGAKCAGLPGAYCPSMLADARKAGAVVANKAAKAGDVVYFDWGNDGESDHVGIVVENRGAYLVTIEGNTSDTTGGSQTNGGVVARKLRQFDRVCGIVRPYYDSSEDDSGDDSGQGGTSTQKLEIDGYIGPRSVAEWQRQCGTTVDGVVSGQLWDCSESYPRLTSVTYDGNGSELMKVVQKAVGVPNPTGIIASGTICMLQGWLVLRGYTCAADRAGQLGEATAKALQKSLNDGMWK